MEENTELEEGEASYCKDDNEGNADLDSLSYIDERIQNALGHFQKDFEGSMSAEKLGAKFGGYGSFLPTYERPPCFLSNPKTPQRNHSSPKSPVNLHTEAVSHNSKAPANVPPVVRPGNSSRSLPSFHDLGAASVEDSVKKGTGVSSSDAAERSTLKYDTTKKTGNSTDQRPLKFRIKMKSNILAQKKAEIYSGLGLDNSPSSSMGNSPVETEGMPPVSQEGAEDSLTAIIQEMTCFPIPGGVLVSPLHESLLYLTKKEIIGGSSYMSSLNGHQEPCSMSTGESDSFAGDGNLKKRTERKMGQNEKQLGLKHMNGTFSENDMALPTKKRLGNKTPDRKDFLSNDLKWTPLSSSICDAGETAEVTAKASEVSKEANENGEQGRMVSVESLKEESLESISGQDFEMMEKKNTGNGILKNVLEHKLKNSRKDNFTDPKNNDKCNTYTVSKKVERNAVKCKVDQKYETLQMVKAVSEGKNKSKGDQSPGKAEAVTRNDSFDDTNNARATGKGSAGFGITSKSKMNKTKSLKDNKVRDGNKDSLKEKKSERKVAGYDGNSAIKSSSIINNEKQSAFGAKVKDRPNTNKVVNQFLAVPGVKDASHSLPCAENNPAPGMIPSAVAAPQLIAEDWVCCDSCQKWRVLPTGIKPEQLPEKWLCSMLDWLPGMNHCDFSEDETTKALYALYQMPISEGQNNMQSHATGIATGVSTADALQLGLNHKKSSSDVLSDRGRKKHVIKEKPMSGINNDLLQCSNSAKTKPQVSGKSRILNDMHQHPGDLKLMKKMSSKHFSRIDDVVYDKHVPKEKEEKINGGDRKHIKLKRKMDADQYRSGTPKKSKTEKVQYADKQLNPGMDHEKVALNSRNDLSTNAGGEDMMNHEEYCLSENVQDRILVPAKKERDKAQVSSAGGSLDVNNSCKNVGLMKKRKMEDWLDNEKHNNSNFLHNDKPCEEEGNASKSRKETKSRILNEEAKSVTRVDDKLSKDGRRQVYTSGSRDQIAVATDVRFVDEGQQPKKSRRSIASHQALDGIESVDPLGKDLGNGDFPLAATSSSSKVSGSHKAKTNFEDLRGSPVESVTSSPLRASNLDKRSLAVGDISVKVDATKGGRLSKGSMKSADNRKGKLSVKLKEDRISDNLHSASHKLSSVEYSVEDAKDKPRVQAKTTSEVENNHLLQGGAPVEQHGNCAKGMNHEEKVNKGNHESELSLQKCGKVTSLHGKEKDRRSDSHVGTDKMKVSASETSYSKNSGRFDSAVDPSYHASGPETRNDAKCSSPKSKREIDSIRQKSTLRRGASETGKQTQIKQKDLEDSVLKMDAQYSTDRKTISQQKLTQDFEEENKANYARTESRDGKSKVLTSAVGDVKRVTLNVGSRTVPRHQRGDMFNENSGHVSSNADEAKLTRNHAGVSSNVEVNSRSGKFAPDQQLNVSSPVTVRTNSSQTAVDTLEEATKLKDRADHFKNSGFDFESNETYFQAGLKFLHGASQLENCSKESSQHGEMSQMQNYATAAKLFKSCAHEYESRKEMASAALAYKCTEVAYMRLVNCKNSSANRDRHELQSTLQMVSQGESPSSSASDIDNLNNQAAVDKATLPRGNNSHVAGNQVISARTRPNLIRLLDFAQDMEFAMEASRKCQSTFTAASVIMEEAKSRNGDSIASISSVVDFSFQDVDELVHLVQIATKAISRAGLGGARD